MSSSNIIIILKIIILSLTIIYASDINPFDDSILYTFKWPGNMKIDSASEKNIIKMVTKELEEYSCVLPEVNTKNDNTDTVYEGGNGLELLAPLFAHTSCAYRFETYWTYEICHGKHVKQYHEERETKIITTQEFYLGRWDSLRGGELSKQLTTQEKDPNYKFPMKKIEGISHPYLQLNYTDGTSCDLNGKPRQTDVLYMCFETGKHDFYSIKEIATCHYELIILTGLLCSHPKYKPINMVEHEINCVGLNKAPIKPISLQKKEAHVSKREIEKLTERISERIQVTLTLESLTKDIEGEERMNRLKLSSTQPKSAIQEFTSLVKMSHKKSPNLKQFLSGEECIIGGEGYWKYEFCYGRYVNQFHEEKDKFKTTIRLGNFDYTAHKLWFARNKNKSRKSNSVTHYYGNGDFCDATKTHRSIEVTFKCKPYPSSLTFASFKEPRTCQYTLELESDMMCTLLPHINEYGIFKIPLS